jgi:hypothetical protein
VDYLISVPRVDTGVVDVLMSEMVCDIFDSRTCLTHQRSCGVLGDMWEPLVSRDASTFTAVPHHVVDVKPFELLSVFVTQRSSPSFRSLMYSVTTACSFMSGLEVAMSR